MLDVVYGPFPALERAFAERLRSIKSADPLAKVLAAAPSRRLADRLQRVTTLDAGLALVEVEFTTFYGLALETALSAGKLERPVEGSGLFYDKLVDRLSGRRVSYRGLPSAIRSSIKDLTDAGVDGKAFLEHVREGLFGTAPGLESLARLYAGFESASAALDVLPPSALVRLAAEAAPESAYLQGFKAILYYGFYDLTGVQLDLFKAVASSQPTTVFFPYRKRPAYAFARRFFEAQLHGGNAPEPAPEPPPAKPRLEVFNAAGPSDELWKAAKGILRLVEEEGFRFSDIGLVARTLEPYRPFLESILGENGIPFHASVEAPLLRHPAGKQALALLTWAQRDFPSVAMLDLLGSPLFKSRSEKWRGLVERLRIHQGWAQWEGKLESWAGSGDEKAVPREEARLLLDRLRALKRDVEPPAGTWRDSAEKALAALGEHLRLGDDEVAEEIRALVGGLASYDRLGFEPSRREFVDTLEEAFRRATLPVSERANLGVRVLDAMSARGESFKALFLIGLKEKLFPRIIREDPFLRDAHRARLRDGAGYWISTKLGGYEEERLLFELLVESASERLVCVTPRSDESGRAEPPSIYLLELMREAGLEAAAPVPLRPAERLRSEAGRLTPKEASILFALEGRDAGALYKRLGWDLEPHERGRQAARALRSFGEPGAYDGMVGPGRRLDERLISGLSPTALQDFATCPFRFFGSSALHLAEPEEPQERKAVGSDVRGTIYHRFLERFYRGLDRIPSSFPKAEFDRTADEVFREYGWRSLGVYPLLWTALRREMLEHLERFVRADLAELAVSGLEPREFELKLEGPAPVEPLDGLGPLAFHGRADRVDVAGGTFRVVDYKTRLWGSGRLETRLARSQALQLAFYLELGGAELGLSPGGAVLAGIEDDERAALDAGGWRAVRETVFKNVGLMLAQIRRGEFFIHPSSGPFGHCGRCAFREACRRTHGPSAARARRAPGFETYQSVLGK